MIPPKKRGWDFEAAFPVVSRDISPEGLSLIHAAELPCERVLIGLEEADALNFIECHVQHCTFLGYGFYQIGLHADKVVPIEFEHCLVLQQQMARFQPQQQSAEAVT